MQKFIIIAALFVKVYQVASECANGCNGHGKCTSYDMCICNKNWQGNDCSERTCLFGLAHVDTPKGDLDMSGDLSTTTKVIDHIVYPYGTTEQFPRMEDTDLNSLPNSAHFYMECSNKGTCDRTSGTCVCYDGYEGVACQRASCPNSCSGNGVCKSKYQLAQADNDNSYLLWDRDLTMGCLCDPGFTGPDCSLRICKYGVDPLYLDDSSTVKYAIYDFATLTTAATAAFTDGTPQRGTGYWAIRFFDMFGEDWLTQPITAGADCDEVIAALEALPNNVIPAGVTQCSKTSKTNKPSTNWKGFDAAKPAGVHSYPIYYNLSIWDAETPAGADDLSYWNSYDHFKGSYTANADTSLSGHIYRIKFYGNPGAIKQPEIEIYLDGQRPSLVSQADGKVLTPVWTDGQQGENNDYIADHCNNVAVTIAKNSDLEFYLNDLTVAEKALLKTCLGDSDFDPSNNVGVYNWDMGSAAYPHIIKLVRSVSAYQDGGYFATLWFDPSVSLDNSGDPNSGTFRLINPFQPPDFLETDQYEIYTTKGTLAMASNASQVVFSFASQYFFTVNSTYDTGDVHWGYDGDISCDITAASSGKQQFITHCINKTDIFTVLNFEDPQYNPPNLNLYTATRLFTQDFAWEVKDSFPSSSSTDKMHYMTHVIKADISSNWGSSTIIPFTSSPFRIYKFFPAVTSTYNYVNECSNRGLCSTDSGLCSCFGGYTNDDCSIQNSIAL